jgi:protein-tyrosine kinase
MSRIHEALQKADQERAVHRSEKATTESANQDASTPAHEDPPAPVNILSSPVVIHSKPETVPAVLKFDELRTRCARPRWHIDPNLVVFHDAGPSGLGTEQFRTLRSRLYRLRENLTIRTLLVTSAVPAEGKTFVATNLAQAIARQKDRRVLLIDADLRSPRIHTLLGAPSTPGLAEYLQGEANELDLIQCGGKEDLYFIPAGKQVTHASELILNGRLQKLLERLAPLFDWVILDSPPALPVADASILAGLCEGVLLVVRAGRTPSITVQKACQELQGTNIVGVALNGMEKVQDYGEYFTYGGYGEKDSK